MNITLDEIRSVAQLLYGSDVCHITPMMSGFEFCLGPLISTKCSLFLKMESLQATGSFKMRGVANQLSKLLPKLPLNTHLLTFSGGNYAKAFSVFTQNYPSKRTILMPDTVPEDRIQYVQELGVKVDICKIDDLMENVESYIQQGMLLVHPIDDGNLIEGYCSVGSEILDSVPDPDVILVPCGGGGLLAGISTVIRKAGLDSTRIYGVEPETAATMHKSFEIGKAASIRGAYSIASGLAPPFAGRLTYPICSAYVTDIILVSDREILNAVNLFLDRGLIVEPSGAAGLAALVAGKVSFHNEKIEKVVVVISGKNVTLESLQQIRSSTK